MNGSVLKIGLACSLALNLFIGGAVIGAAFQRNRMVEMRTAPVPGNPMMRAADDLSPDDRAAYRQRMRQMGLNNQPLLEASRAAREKVIAAFSQPSFDAAAASQALSDSRQAELAARAQLETALVEFAKGLGVDERKKLAASIGRGGPGGPGDRGGGRGRGPRGGGFRGSDDGGPPRGGPPPPANP